MLDLVKAVLVDPSLHTDARMRISAQLTDLLNSAHDEMHRSGPPPSSPPRPGGPAHGRPPVDLLSDVLVDPNLHTDLRLALHERIAELLDQAA